MRAIRDGGSTERKPDRARGSCSFPDTTTNHEHEKYFNDALTMLFPRSSHRSGAVRPVARAALEVVGMGG
jgi:hypothetical protein